MKKILLICTAMLCLVSCGKQSITNPDTLRAAVISQSGSQSAYNTLSLLHQSTVATLTADMVDVSMTEQAAQYDLLYIDKSVAAAPEFDAQAIQEYVRNGGSVFLDNETYDLFDKDFIGAEDFVPIYGSPADMVYHMDLDKPMLKIQNLIWDFCSIYKSYTNYEDTLAYQSYGVGVIPSTAQCITSKDDAGVYTLNQYGDGYVFFTNPILPNDFSVNNLSPADYGEPLAASTVGANKLIRDYFAEFVSLKKYGYAVENVAGSFARSAAAWDLSCADIYGIENGSAEIFSDMCMLNGQIPSFNLARNPYAPMRRAESVTYALIEDGKYSMDAYENAYSSGTHFISNTDYLTLDTDDNTGGSFAPSTDFVKRAYPCPDDVNGDGIMDLICGSADGGIYYYEGRGMKQNFEFGEKAALTDTEGNPIRVEGYSSPCLADIDGDGINELITGSDGGQIFAYKPSQGTTFEYMGVIADTYMQDAMPAFGDINGDGLTDMAVGSRGGELRIYYGDMGTDGTEFNSYENVDTGQSWCAPCIADVDGDGRCELYAGTSEGYIALFENNVFNGYMEGNECNYMGNINLKFGNNCVPRFYDIDGDGAQDLIAGSYEYGLAVPIDSVYFRQRETLQNQIDKFREQGIYIGVDMLTHEHADPFHDKRELLYQKRAFNSYVLDFENIGATQLDGNVSKVGYDTHYDNTRGYDGTYAEQMKAGLLWNSSSKTPDSLAAPGMCAENAIPVPFYLNNGQLFAEPCNTPDGTSAYTYMSVKYELPLIFRNDCSDTYYNRADEEEKIKKVSRIVNDNGYTFVCENQLMKMIAAQMNNHVDAKWENDTLYLSSSAKETDRPLFDKHYQKAAGVKVIFADDVITDEFSADASVAYKKNNCIYVSLDKGARISKNGESNDINITSVSLPADISKNKNGASVTFRDDGLMSVAVKGSVKTDSKGWEVTQQDGTTTFTKYGKAEKLKIVR